MTGHHERLGNNKIATSLVEALAWRIHCEAVGIPRYYGGFDDIPEFMRNDRIEEALREAGIV